MVCVVQVTLWLKKNYFITCTLTACHCISADSRILTLLFFCVENPRQKVPHCAIMFIWDNCHVSNSPLLFCFSLSFSFSCIFNSSSSRSFALYTYSEVKTKTETHFTLFTYMLMTRHVSVLLFLLFKCWGGGGWFLAICLFFSCLSGLVVNTVVLLVQS